MPINESVLRDRYTRITEGTDGKDRPVFNVWLRVGQQEFCVTPNEYRNRQAAELMAMALARALGKIIKEKHET